MNEFCISLQYLDPKFYKKDSTGFLADCIFEHTLFNENEQIIFLNKISCLVESLNDQTKFGIFCEHSWFDPLYQFCSKINSLKKNPKTKLITLLIKSIEKIISQIKTIEIKNKPLLRNSLKAISFLCCTLINTYEKYEKEKNKNEWNWNFERERLLEALISILACDNVKKLWNMNTVEEEFGNMFFKTSITLFESTKSIDKLSKIVFKMIALNMQMNSYLQLTFSATFTHMLLNKDLFSSKIASFCIWIVENYSMKDVLGNMLREIGRLNDTNLSKNNKGAENIGAFLVKITSKLPSFVYKEIEILLPFLDCSCYKMRNGILEVIKELILNLESIIDQNEKEIKLNEEKELNNQNNKNEKRNKNKKFKVGENEDCYDFVEKYISNEIWEKSKNLLSLIEKRVLDIISFTRSKALTVLKELIDTQSIPFSDHLIKITKICKNRLKEKSSSVRKNAVKLLTSLVIKNYPINHMKYRKKKQQLFEILNVVNKAETISKETSNLEQNNKIESKKLSEKSKEKLETEFNAVSSACSFMDEVSYCFPDLCNILSSKGNFDVLESINFYKVASELNIPESESGFRKMLSLVWNKESVNIVDGVIDAYYEKYIYYNEKEKSEVNLKYKNIAENLVLLIGKINSIKELACLEEIIIIMLQKEKIPYEVIISLWKIFKHLYKKDVESANNALYILSVITSIKPEVINEILNDIVNIVSDFVNDVKSNKKLKLQYFFLILERNSQNKKTSSDSLIKIENLLTKIIFSNDSFGSNWYPTINAAIPATFSLMNSPEKLFEKILKEFFEKKNLSDEEELAKFLFILGNVAVSILVRLEKKENFLKSKKWKKDKISMLIENATKQKYKNKEISDYYKINDGEKEYRIEQMREKSEDDLVQKNLMGAFGKIVVDICENLVQFENKRLKRSAVLTFCKFMCISKSFCFEQLNLLFSIMENEEDSILKTNIIISLGDISFRFPNLTAPFITKMFVPLHSEESSVRKNTLLVISHLILNDMIKVKESISEIAVAITDNEKAIRDLSKLFFQEFSKKGKNPIYNILPDIISKMTYDNVEKEKFEIILKELIRYITDEKQQENLIFKICTRFSKINDKNQLRNNFYCLTLINYTDKCIKKFIEMARCYESLLKDKKIKELLKYIINKAKKANLKQENKDLLINFEKKIITNNKKTMLNEKNKDSDCK